MPKIKEFYHIYNKRWSASETINLGILAHFRHFRHF
jgi:hypothetical protein